MVALVYQGDEVPQRGDENPRGTGEGSHGSAFLIGINKPPRISVGVYEINNSMSA